MIFCSHFPRKIGNSLIINADECQEEARRIIDIVSEQIYEMENFSILEGIIAPLLNIDPSDYVLRKGYT